MFIRRKKNKSGVISVQVIDKSNGTYRVLRTVGSSIDDLEIEHLVSEGENWIKQSLAYDIFEGNQFEGNTMLPIIDAFKQKYNLQKMIVVADAGLLSKENVARLHNGGYEYILGARIKAESKITKQKILSLQLKNGQSAVIRKDACTNLIISYSDSRAKKDAHNRARGLTKLQKHIKTGKLTKASINNRGYNKFLQIENQVNVSINEYNIAQDQKWDGLKGYTTNTTLSNDEVIKHYRDLWLIEKAFRVAKTDLEIRPIYHRNPRRIEAHICIAFVAYKIYKELERQLKEEKSTLSPEKAIEIAKTIYAVKIKHPITNEVTSVVHIKTQEQKSLAKLFGF